MNRNSITCQLLKDKVKLKHIQTKVENENLKQIRIIPEATCYVVELVGIKIQTVNESHTSKCDSFALESIKHHDKYKGKRKERGLFQSSINKLVNADVNGALNI